MARAYVREAFVVRHPPATVPIVAVGASVAVYVVGTSTPVSGSLWDARTSGSAQSNPIIADSSGAIEFWRDTYESVDLVISHPDLTTPVRRTVSPILDGDDIVRTTSGAQSIGTGKTFDSPVLNTPTINSATFTSVSMTNPTLSGGSWANPTISNPAFSTPIAGAMWIQGTGSGGRGGVRVYTNGEVAMGDAANDISDPVAGGIDQYTFVLTRKSSTTKSEAPMFVDFTNMTRGSGHGGSIDVDATTATFVAAEAGARATNGAANVLGTMEFRAIYGVDTPQVLVTASSGVGYGRQTIKVGFATQTARTSMLYGAAVAKGAYKAEQAAIYCMGDGRGLFSAGSYAPSGVPGNTGVLVGGYNGFELMYAALATGSTDPQAAAITWAVDYLGQVGIGGVPSYPLHLYQSANTISGGSRFYKNADTTHFGGQYVNSSNRFVTEVQDGTRTGQLVQGVATSDAGLQVNAVNGLTGWILEGLVNGTSKFSFDNAGAFYIGGVRLLNTQQTGIAVVTGTADLTYDATERDMLNTLNSRMNSVRAILNAHGLTTTV